MSVMVSFGLRRRSQAFPNRVRATVFDEICSGYLLEILTQVIGVHVDDVRDFGQGKFFARVFFDILSRFPDRNWLGCVPTSRIFNLSSGQHLHRTTIL